MANIDKLNKIIDANLDKMDISEELKNKLTKEANKKFNFKRLGYIGTPIVAAILAFVVLLTGQFSTKEIITVYGDNLMDNIAPQKVKTVKLDDNFIKATSNFSVELLKHSFKEEKNTLISPTSVYLALGMTANGADGSTLKEFEALLGNNNIDINGLNLYYNSFAKKLTNNKEGKVSIANSIWYRDDDKLKIQKSFLQSNADYYNAAAYKADFTNPKTVDDINNWVNRNTGKQIDKIVDKTDPDSVMFLINAVYFENKWKNPYQNSDVHKNSFQLIDGSKKPSDFMRSTESVYLKDDKSEGFIKPYKDGRYSFLALLPNEGINIDSYISSLSGESFIKLLNTKTNEGISVTMPKFKSEFNIDLVASLQKMGLNECFDYKANFNKMTTKKEKLCIENVIHKTSIIVAEEGTKAAAATKIEMKWTSITVSSKREIILNRPFLYAIIDNESNLPLFMGVMMNPEN